MLPQCSSHDFMEGAVKLWLKLILENLVMKRWFSWKSLERMMKFKFRGKDSNNRPAPMRSKVMKVKKSRRIIGTFAEVSCLIRSFPQMAYDHIRNSNDPYWQFLLKIRSFLRFLLMPKITDQQVLFLVV